VLSGQEVIADMLTVRIRRAIEEPQLPPPDLDIAEELFSLLDVNSEDFNDVRDLFLLA
jgi:hypothetical protein